MIYIKKSIDNQFFADIISGSNGKNLGNVETHTQKHNCWKNIFAIAAEFNGYNNTYLVTDISGKKKKVYEVFQNVKTLIK